MPDSNQQQVSNKEILQILKSMQDKSESIIVLTPTEIQTFRDILKTITVDDLRYIKEYSEDRKAVTRVLGKVKNFILVTAAIVVAYFAIIRNVLPPLRELLLKFLQGGG
jgi:hypothetical protein